MNTPRHLVTNITRHEWIIGDSGSPTTARDLSDGIHTATAAMMALGLDLSHDDAYMVRAGDGGEVILYADVVESHGTVRIAH